MSAWGTFTSSQIERGTGWMWAVWVSTQIILEKSVAHSITEWNHLSIPFSFTWQLIDPLLLHKTPCNSWIIEPTREWGPLLWIFGLSQQCHSASARQRALNRFFTPSTSTAPILQVTSLVAEAGACIMHWNYKKWHQKMQLAALV